jgi:DNA-binding phage protein
LDEAIDLFVNGDPESSKLILRDLVNATVGFEALAEEVHKPAKSLHRMLSQQGNPTMSNISAVFAAVKRRLNVNSQERVVMARCTTALPRPKARLMDIRTIRIGGGQPQPGDHPQGDGRAGHPTSRAALASQICPMMVAEMKSGLRRGRVS